ncbi:MAG: DUF4346 domain-containing protein [Mycobacterium leprae]
MAGLQQILQQVQPELAAVHDRSKCRHCESLLDVVQGICDDLRGLGAADSPDLNDWLAEGNAYRHANLGCEVCLAMEPYNRWGYLKQRAQVECMVAAGEQPVPPFGYHPDPAGSFRVLLVPESHELVCEHYTTEGHLDAIIRGTSAEALINAVLERGLVSRLDHAAYLGRELGKAETALRQNQPYTQE